MSASLTIKCDRCGSLAFASGRSEATFKVLRAGEWPSGFLYVQLDCASGDLCDECWLQWCHARKKCEGNEDLLFWQFLETASPKG